MVVGDTPHDIRCGKHIGAKVLAVATGGAKLEELKNAQARLGGGEFDVGQREGSLQRRAVNRKQFQPRMNTDKYGLIGEAGSSLPAARQNAKRGSHGVTRLACECFVFIRVHPCASVVKNQMKIGIACYPSVGSGILATALGEDLARRGHEVHFFS